ncbi:hypothetical protein BGZ61DRAFT_135665 [Ilyonectria robusta]|uniref:uncharacterized protein n=1 Tax=Ilyonectria robusta TaxID=1079257 RepID=UPI001E8EC0CF|nr:uncharacterized protein BGZ61DRAFT_135665 [Ilyonectria robusta]KAH8735133.1 hypothetical protein BGZ61DRAFT_135665 [Ilyonectria robusta]
MASHLATLHRTLGLDVIRPRLPVLPPHCDGVPSTSRLLATRSTRQPSKPLLSGQLFFSFSSAPPSTTATTYIAPSLALALSVSRLRQTWKPSEALPDVGPGLVLRLRLLLGSSYCVLPYYYTTAAATTTTPCRRFFCGTDYLNSLSASSTRHVPHPTLLRPGPRRQQAARNQPHPGLFTLPPLWRPRVCSASTSSSHLRPLVDSALEITNHT